jgi:small-conductance mechanosensitive channel
VAYDSDLEKVEKVTLEAAQQILNEVEGGYLKENPSLRFQNLGDSGIGLSVYLRVKEYSKQYLIKHEFIKRLMKRYKEEGIVIPYPVRTIEFAEGSNLPFKEPR